MNSIVLFNINLSVARCSDFMDMLRRLLNCRIIIIIIIIKVPFERRQQLQLLISVLCRRGVRVGVLSGPGHCTNKHRYPGRTKSSLVMAASRGGNDAASLIGSDRGLLAVQLNLPHHVGTSSNVRCYLSIYLTKRL